MRKKDLLRVYNNSMGDNIEFYLRFLEEVKEEKKEVKKERILNSRYI